MNIPKEIFKLFDPDSSGEFLKISELSKFFSQRFSVGSLELPLLLKVAK